MTTAPANMFSASQIARIVGRHKKFWQRTARRENWPCQRHGNTDFFHPRRDVLLLCNRVGSSAPQLNGVAAKAGNVRFMQRLLAVELLREILSTGAPREAALRKAVRLLQFSPSASSLRRWTAQYAAAGLAGLAEHKRGRVGRKVGGTR